MPAKRTRWVCLAPGCGAPLEPGVALAQTAVGAPDFAGDARPVTLSPGGPGKLTPCLKCPRCGYSMTIPTKGHNAKANRRD